MALEIGSRLAHYDVTALIGEGGMGQVYQATDTKLNRQVALKILPEAFATDPDRLARFQREAQVLASLNHPNIAQIHGIEEQDDTRALVLELVEGPTLAERISKGPIPIDEALPIAKQIAEALEAAHEAGVIHRDLKPANIKVREDGTVKVLDFGLAKALDPSPTGDPSQSPTLTAAATQMGVIMGTAAYMSPEQARGKPVDKRADIWAFGVVLYEMLSGQRLFQGDDVSLTLAKVLETDPTWEALPSASPPRIANLLQRCLQKDPRQRVQAIGDVRLVMEGAFETATASSSERLPTQTPLLGQHPLTVLAIIATAVLVTGLAMWSVMRPESPRLVRLAVSPDIGLPLFTALQSPDLAISPDGEQIAYLTGSVGLGAEQLQVRSLARATSEILVGEGVLNSPFFSADSQSVGFYDHSVEPALLKRVSVQGGATQTICELTGDLRGASWGADGTIVFASSFRSGGGGSGLFRVAAVGGAPEQLTTPDAEQGEFAHAWPEILPGGKAVLFSVLRGTSPSEDTEIAVLSLETGEQKVVLRGGTYPRYSPSGHLVYGVQGNLWAVRFDPSRLETVGDPVPVQERVLGKSLGATNFSISDGGTLVYLPVVAAPEAPGTLLVWVDREGRQEPVNAERAVYLAPRISPDGQRIAVAIGNRQDEDIWVIDSDRGTRTRLTTFPGRDIHPLWTPDGQRLTFASNGGGPAESPRVLFWMPADGSGTAEPLTEATKRNAGRIGCHAECLVIEKEVLRSPVRA